MQQALSARPESRIARYLSVEVRAQHYAVDILKIQEIRAYTPPTPVPRLPPHVRGVDNLHGAIVPVIDLAQRLGLEPEPCGRLAVIVFVTVGTQVAGLIVEAASRVIDLELSQIRPPPDLGLGIDMSFISGVARQSERVIVIIDVDTLLRSDAALVTRSAGPAGEGGPGKVCHESP